MRKQHFAKAAPLTGAFFLCLFSFGACTTTTIVEDFPDGSLKKDGSTSATGEGGTLPRPRSDGGGSGGDDGGSTGDDGGGTTSGCPGSAPTSADLDQNGGWNAPNAINTTACSVSDFNTFGNNLNNSNITSWNDLVNGLSASCSSCILSQQTATHWQLIVTDSTGQNGFVNYGACYAVGPGGSAACGKAVQYDQFCVDTACGGCADAQFQSCQSSKTTQSECATNFGSMIQSSCPSDQTAAQKLDSACGSLLNAAAVLCGRGEPDGGTLPP